jgi:hypothetical protein
MNSIPSIVLTVLFCISSPHTTQRYGGARAHRHVADLLCAGAGQPAPRTKAQERIRRGGPGCEDGLEQVRRCVVLTMCWCGCLSSSV